jgi:hypothetical protein
LLDISSRQGMEKAMKSFLWMLIVAGSVIGASIFITGVLAAKGAPQEAAAAAMGVACGASLYFWNWT